MVLPERPLIKYLCMLPDLSDANQPDTYSGQCLPVETYSPELARQIAADRMQCDPKRLYVVNVTKNPAMLAMVDDMLAELKRKCN